MKDNLIKVKEFCKTYKKRIITVISISVLAVIVAVGVVSGVVYSKAKANVKYSEEKLQKIALGKVPGEVIKVEKELNFEEAVYEYEFKIKDKENMLQTVKLDSQYGLILRVNNEKSKNGNNESHREHKEKHGEHK